MTQDSVKKKIKKKFGSYSEFARIGEIDRYEFQRDFLTANRVSKADLKKYSDLCDKLASIDKMIPQVKVEELRASIDLNYHSVRELCRQQTRFTEVTVFRILGGGVRVTSPKAKELFKFFKIEI